MQVLAGIGATTVIVACVVLLVLLVERFFEHRAYVARQSAESVEESVRSLLSADARWFSEDPETVWLLEGFVRRDVGELRDEWRRRRRANATQHWTAHRPFAPQATSQAPARPAPNAEER